MVVVVVIRKIEWLGICRLFILLRLQFGCTIGEFDFELLCPIHDLLPFFNRHTRRDLRTVFPVLHHEHLQLGQIAHSELVESVLQHEPCFLVRPVPDVGHKVRALEFTTHSAVDTLGLPPVGLNTFEPIALKPREFSRALLDNFHLLQRLNRHHWICETKKGHPN